MNETLRNSRVEEISVRLAHPFIREWHYAERLPMGMNVYFGWWARDGGGNGGGDGGGVGIFGEYLYAVADYGIGVNPYQAGYLSRVTGLEIEEGELLEIKRLCRVEPKVEELPLTAFLARCHRELRRRGYKYIVSFSDPAYGHNGGIYKAANFTWLGQTQAEFHVVDGDDKVRHRRYYYRYAQKKGISNKEARKELGLRIVKTVPKDRWFLAL